MGPEALTEVLASSAVVATAATEILATGAPRGEAAAAVLPLLLAQLSHVIASDGGRAAAVAEAAQSAKPSGDDSAGEPGSDGGSALGTGEGGVSKEVQARRRLIQQVMRHGSAAAVKAAAGGHTSTALLLRGLGCALIGGVGLLLGVVGAAMFGLEEDGVGLDGGSQASLFVHGAW